MAMRVTEMTIWPVLRMRMSPPNCANWLIVSTSEVTRETIDPRRWELCVSIERSWTCRKAVVRSVASPPSAARKSRTLTR